MANESNEIRLSDSAVLRVTRVQIIGDIVDNDGNTVGSPNRVAEISAQEAGGLGLSPSELLSGKYVSNGE